MTTNPQRVAFRCWKCGIQTMVQPECPVEPLAPCCFETLKEMANAFGHAMIHQLPHHLGRLMEKASEFNDKLADAAILSPDPEVRAAAIRWRNERGARKQDNG